MSTFQSKQSSTFSRFTNTEIRWSFTYKDLAQHNWKIQIPTDYFAYSTTSLPAKRCGNGNAVKTKYGNEDLLNFQYPQVSSKFNLVYLHLYEDRYLHALFMQWVLQDYFCGKNGPPNAALNSKLERCVPKFLLKFCNSLPMDKHCHFNRESANCWIFHFSGT